MTEIKIINIHTALVSQSDFARKEASEAELERLVNDGWSIVASGGVSNLPSTGFVILQKK